MAGIVDWLRGHLPTRESIAGNRWLAPFAGRLMHSSLWRFNRRSVPRGVALGLAAGLAVPFAHTVIAAVLAIPLRANVLISAATTWISNPITWIVIFPAERAIGKFLIGLSRAAPAPDVAMQAGTAMQGWLGWLLKTSGEIALGSVVLGLVAGAVGYLLMVQIWRVRIARKWRKRHTRG
jgi:uncharacterized protein